MQVTITTTDLEPLASAAGMSAEDTATRIYQLGLEFLALLAESQETDMVTEFLQEL